MMSGGVTMMDPIALSLIQEHGGQFGRERLFSSIGMALFSPLTGLLMDHYSQHAGKMLPESLLRHRKGGKTFEIQ